MWFDLICYFDKFKIFTLKFKLYTGINKIIAPWYERIVLSMDFGRFPLQSYCDGPYSPIVIIHGENERRGMDLVTYAP